MPTCCDIGGATYIVPQHIWRRSAARHGHGRDADRHRPLRLEELLDDTGDVRGKPALLGGTPPVGQIDIPSFSSNSSAATAFATAQLDWAGQRHRQRAERLRGQGPVLTTTPSSLRVTRWLAVVQRRERRRLADPKVRQAISYGIDRAQLGTEGESGYEQPATSTSGLILPTSRCTCRLLTPTICPRPATRARLASILQATATPRSIQVLGEERATDHVLDRGPHVVLRLLRGRPAHL